MPRDDKEAADILRHWAHERMAQGKRAPASPQRPDLLSLQKVEQETGISRFRYNRAHQPLRQLLDTLVVSLGGLEIEWDRDAFAGDVIHLQLARSLCMKHFEIECAEAGRYFEPDRLMLEKLFTVAAKRNEAGWAAPAQMALAALKQDIERGNVRGGDAFEPYIDTALELVDRQMQRRALPERFADRLDYLVGKSGLSRSQAASRIGVTQGTFNSWCTGAKAPDRSFWPKVMALETLLAIEPGTLVDAIAPRRSGTGRISRSLFPVPLQSAEHAALRSEISRQMPADFFSRPIAEQKRLLVLKYEDLEREASTRRSWYDLRHSTYRLHPFPPALEEEWQKLVRFKTGEILLARDTSGPVAAQKCWRKQTTIATNRDRLAHFFGFLVDHAPPDLRITQDQASLIHLADVRKLFAYLEFKQDRQTRFTGSARLTKTDLDLLTLAAALLSPLDGFLRLDQCYATPFLTWRDRFRMLPPDIEMPAAERDRRDHQDLQDICNRLRDDIKRLEASFRGRASNPSSHHARIEPLLSDPAPLQQFYARLTIFQAEMETMDTARIGYWRAVRSLMLLHLVAQFPARRSMLVKLDYRPDNSGHLRQIDGKWVLSVPVDMFKNDQAARFSGLTTIDHEIEDIYGAYAAIALYVEEARWRLLRGKSSDALLVSTYNQPRYSPQALDNLFRALFARLMGPGAGAPLHLPAGFTMTIHGMRDLVATATLKASGDFQIAADAILDSESTVRRTYARYKPSDRMERLKLALNRARALGDDGQDAKIETPPDAQSGRSETRNVKNQKTSK
mgnify:CR=1 FL=1|jgi:hypothetical protein